VPAWSQRNPGSKKFSGKNKSLAAYRKGRPVFPTIWEIGLAEWRRPPVPPQKRLGSPVGEVWSYAMDATLRIPLDHPVSLAFICYTVYGLPPGSPEYNKRMSTLASRCRRGFIDAFRDGKNWWVTPRKYFQGIFEAQKPSLRRRFNNDPLAFVREFFPDIYQRLSMESRPWEENEGDLR